MTEAEWFAWDDPRSFLQTLTYLIGRPGLTIFSERKLRLFAIACCRRVRGHCTDTRTQAAIQAAEAFADAKTNTERQQIRFARKTVLNDGWWHTTEGRLAGAVLSPTVVVARIVVAWSCDEGRRCQDDQVYQVSRSGPAK